MMWIIIAIVIIVIAVIIGKAAGGASARTKARREERARAERKAREVDFRHVNWAEGRYKKPNYYVGVMRRFGIVIGALVAIVVIMVAIGVIANMLGHGTP
jgi:hypothetical protein